MHAVHFDPRVWLAGLVALLLAVAVAAVAPALTELDFGGSTSQPAPAQQTAQPASPPQWVTDPLAPPPLLSPR